MQRFFILIVLLFGLMYSAAAQDKLNVVATTTILADVARNVGGDLVNVTALVPADADTHAWTPTPADVATVAEADVVLAVGAGYEQFLGTLVENAGKTPVIVTNGVEMLPFGGHHEHEHEAEASEDFDMTAWNGDFISGSLFTADPALDAFYQAIVAATEGITAEEAKTFVSALYHTDFDRLTVSDGDLTFTVGSDTLTCHYVPAGVEAAAFGASTFNWYLFNLESGPDACEAYRYLLATELHSGDAAGSDAHWHMRYGSTSFDDLMTNPSLANWWPTLSTTVSSGQQMADGLINAAADFAAMMQMSNETTPPETHDHDHESLGIFGEAGVCDEAHEAHDEAEEHEHGACDPHVWTAPENVAIWAANIAEAFAEADPANAETYRANAEAYAEQLTALDAELRDILSIVPEEGRILITNHEFLGYFAHEYDFEVVGVVIEGGSTASEPDPQSLAELIDIIQTEGVGAVFAEVSANTGLAETVAQESGVGVVTALYSESLSAADDPASTYLDYMRYNAQTIADALQ